jgi:hypothetical protein
LEEYKGFIGTPLVIRHLESLCFSPKDERWT